MDNKQKNKIIDIFTFITHFIISLSFVWLGWFAISWANAWRTGENLTIDYFIIIAGIILFFVNLSLLFKHSFKTYIITLLVTLTSAITWITIEVSTDVSNILPIYVIIFVPLAFYKYRLNNDE